MQSMVTVSFKDISIPIEIFVCARVEVGLVRFKVASNWFKEKARKEDKCYCLGGPYFAAFIFCKF